MRILLATISLALALSATCSSAQAALTSNGLFDKGTALSDTHVEVTGIELPASVR